MYAYIVPVNALKEGPMEEWLYQIGYLLQIKNLLTYLHFFAKMVVFLRIVHLKF